MCEEIRDTFPAGHILTVPVAPHQNGECPLQSYNSLLSLSSLHRFYPLHLSAILNSAHIHCMKSCYKIVNQGYAVSQTSTALYSYSCRSALLFHNDQALAFAQTLEGVPMSTASLSVEPTAASLTVMNAHNASCMADLLLPAQSLKPTGYKE